MSIIIISSSFTTSLVRIVVFLFSMRFVLRMSNRLKKNAVNNDEIIAIQIPIKIGSVLIEIKKLSSANKISSMATTIIMNVPIYKFSKNLF